MHFFLHNRLITSFVFLLHLLLYRCILSIPFYPSLPSFRLFVLLLLSLYHLLLLRTHLTPSPAFFPIFFSFFPPNHFSDFFYFLPYLPLLILPPYILPHPSSRFHFLLHLTLNHLLSHCPYALITFVSTLPSLSPLSFLPHFILSFFFIHHVQGSTTLTYSPSLTT
jgi:hypothetical protein